MGRIHDSCFFPVTVGFFPVTVGFSQFPMANFAQIQPQEKGL